MENKHLIIIIIILVIIEACLLGGYAIYSNVNENDNSNVINTTTDMSNSKIVETETNNEVSDSSPKSITIDVPSTSSFEKTASLGNYIIEVSRGSGSDGAFSVIVIDPNGGYLNPNSYSSQLYYSNGGPWQWNGWDDYSNGGFNFHRYFVYDSKVSKVMVQLNI